MKNLHVERYLEPFLLPESRLMIKTVEQFCVQQLNQKMVNTMESEDRIPSELIEAATKLKLFGLRIPLEFGGVGADLLTTSIILETVSSYSLSFSVYLDETLFVEPVLRYGNTEQKQEYLSPIAELGFATTSAMTEPGAGSDILGTAATAVKRDGRWVLNGAKTFISLGDQAEYFIIFAKTEPERTNRSLSAFLVKKSNQGLRVGQPIRKMGQRGTHANELFLDNLEVQNEDMLGKPGDGYEIALYSYRLGRVIVAAQALGLAEGVLAKSAAYASTRSAFGKKIAKFQLIQEYLAEMETLIEAARGLVYRAAVTDETCPSELPSIAKYFATEASSKVAHMALRIHGGLGVATQTGLEQCLRDSIIQEIYEGTNEIQKLIIAGSVLKRVAS